MRTGLHTVFSTDSIEFEEFTGTWEGDSTVYGYAAVTLDRETETLIGSGIGTSSGTLEVGDLVRIENIPMGHRRHTHRQWAVGPVEAIWAAPREVTEGDDGTETIELEAEEFDPESLDSWPGVTVAVEVRAPRLGGDVPLSRCEFLDEPPEAYVDRYGDDRSEGLWVNEPIRKDEVGFGPSDHLPDRDEDDREPEYIGTDGHYDTYQEMRQEMYKLPARDANAPDDNPTTERPYSVTVSDDHVRVGLLNGRGEERMRDVAGEFDATVSQADGEEERPDIEEYAVSLDE